MGFVCSKYVYIYICICIYLTYIYIYYIYMYIYSHSGSFNGRFDGWFTGLYWKQETHQPMRKGWGSCTQTSSVVNWDLLLWPPPPVLVYLCNLCNTYFLQVQGSSIMFDVSFTISGSVQQQTLLLITHERCPCCFFHCWSWLSWSHPPMNSKDKRIQWWCAWGTSTAHHFFHSKDWSSH